MTKGYWVVRANVFNMDEYSEYVKLATNIIKKYKGKEYYFQDNKFYRIKRDKSKGKIKYDLNEIEV